MMCYFQVRSGHSHLYEAAGREQALWNVGPAGAILAVYTANVGNRVGAAELDGSLTTWGYDRSCQLTSEQRSGPNAYNASYLYDGVGNRTLKGESGQFTTYLYSPANELTWMQPPTGQPTTNVWDANGNLKSENAGGQFTSYSWDYEDRMTGVSYANGTLDTFLYREDGLRQKKVTSAGETGFLWDGQNVLLETDGTGATAAHYTDFPGYWGGLASQRRANVSSFFGFDMSANTRLFASAAGAETDASLYRAFGEEVAASGSTVNPLRFGGQVGYYRDLAARLYIRAREYEPELGRWMSRDPLTGLNTYEGPLGYGSGPAWHILSLLKQRELLKLGVLAPAMCQYLYGPPVNLVDPTGWTPIDPKKAGDIFKKCDEKANKKCAGPGYVECYKKYMQKCLVGDLCIQLVCKVVKCPQGRNPCDPTSDWVSAECDCCQIKYDCCLAQKGLIGTWGCYAQNLACNCEHDCIAGGRRGE